MIFLISASESGKVAFSSEAFSMKELLIIVLLLRMNVQWSVNFHTADSSGLMHDCLIGSPLHVRQILINIIGNAIKYNKEHGEIDMIVKESLQDHHTAMIQLQVRDTGIGMSPEFLSQIFHPFTQEGQQARTTYAGTGLGMAITTKNWWNRCMEVFR